MRTDVDTATKDVEELRARLKRRREERVCMAAEMKRLTGETEEKRQALIRERESLTSLR